MEIMNPKLAASGCLQKNKPRPPPMTMLLITTRAPKSSHPNRHLAIARAQPPPLAFYVQLMAPKKPIKLAWRGIKDILST
jgi:hypothetical protein